MSIETFQPLTHQDTGELTPLARSVDPYIGRHEALEAPETTGIGDVSDLITVDRRERGHRPDGKFLSAHEVGKIALFADEIRAGLPGRQQAATEHSGVASELAEYETVDSHMNPSTAFTVEGDMPSLDVDERTPTKLTKVRSFFARRAAQIRQVSDRANTVTQSIYARNIEGVDMSAGTMLRARIQPANVAHNLRSLAPTVQNNTENERYNHAVDNPVLRGKMYEAAASGNEQARQYLAKHDANYGKYEDSTVDALKEAAAIFSGAAAAHRIGVNVLKLTLIGKEIFERDPSKRQEIGEKFDKVSEAHKHMYGSRAAEKKRAMYASALQKRRDPFDGL